MTVTPIDFRKDLFKLLDFILESGKTLEINRNGHIIKVVPPYASEAIVKSLSDSIDLKVLEERFDKVAYESVKQNWTRDPFDRIIVAQAMCENAQLLTKDRKILEHFGQAVW